MSFELLFFLSSGLFLGWSLGVNDAANIFGTAVGTKMVKFHTAAIISSVFVILGAVISGAGTSETLEKLGSVNALAGAFMVALCAAISILTMSRNGLTVSTSQAIIGSIVGWNIYCGKTTDISLLGQIVLTWVLCPILAAVVAVILYCLLKSFLNHAHIHLIRQDCYTRIGLILIGALGAYALGANNIANVIGVFVKDNPFHAISTKYFDISPLQVLLFIGALSIAVGIFTYSHKTMMTVGNSLMKMSPLMALVVVLANSIVLLLFSSKGLNIWLYAHRMPQIPLVPISSTQAVIGAIIGIGIYRGGRGIHWKIVGKIALGWVAAPLMALVLCFICLFFLENVFNQTVYLP